MLNNVFESLGLARGNAAGHDSSVASLGENLVYSRPEIEQTVEDLRQGQMPVMLLCAGETIPFVSQVMHVEREKGYFLLRQVSHEQHHALILEQDFFNLCGQVDGHPVMMSVRLDRLEMHAGALCYRVPLPTWVLSSQARDPIRLRLKPNEPSVVSFTTGGDVQIKGWICNLSEGGVGFCVDEDEAHAMRPGQTLIPVTMQLAQEEFSGLSLEVKHISRTDAGQYLVGARLMELSETLRQTLRCYLQMLLRDSAHVA